MVRVSKRMISLVDPIYMKVPKKIVFKEKSISKEIFPSNKIPLMIFLFFVFFVFWYVWDYIKVTPIVDPDFDCLPKNIRDAINWKKVVKPSVPSSKIEAYNNDSLTIKYSIAR